jgi:hypothetical protein
MFINSTFIKQVTACGRLLHSVQALLNPSFSCTKTGLTYIIEAVE